MISEGEQNNKVLTGYPAVDKPWLKYYSKEAIEATVPEGSMYDYMMFNNKDALSDIALNYFGRKITYKQLNDEIEKCAQALTAMGIGQGDVVSLNMLSMPETVYLLYAINRLGAICNFLVANGTVEEIEKHIKTAESKLVITVDVMADKVLEAVKEDNIPVIIARLGESMPVLQFLFAPKAGIKTGALVNWQNFIRRGNGVSCSYPRVSSGNTAVIVYTSGTTGESKGTLLSNQAANAVAFQYIQAEGVLEFQRKQSFLNIIPPFTSFGLFCALHMPLCVGLETILSPDSLPKHFGKILLKYKPNHFCAGPLHINNMLSNTKVNKADLSFIITASYGGDVGSKEWEKSVSVFLQQHGCRYGLVKGYGLTEMASTFGIQGQHTKAMIPLVKNNIKILDLDNGQALSYGQEGELCISGPSMMTGYFNHQEETENMIWEEAGACWLHTGDLGYVSEDGYFYITGRMKRILWAVGENGIISRVYPMKIEEVIATHPDVKKCAVVGILNGEKGYFTKAFVVGNQPETERLKTELFELCREHLPQESQPVYIEFLKDLPFTLAGKVDYRSLESMAQKGSLMPDILKENMENECSEKC